MSSRIISKKTAPSDVSVPAANDAEAAAAVPAAVDLTDKRLYIHRELSQLQFNIRVLDQALDERTPLL